MNAFLDKIEVTGTHQRPDGYLVVDARVARAGIQTYAGSEVGKPDLNMVRVWRPETEVFADAAMASFTHRPITNDHPKEAVTSDNWKVYAVGFSSDMVARDGGFLRVPLMVADKETITAISDGKRELSAGYTSDLKWEAGTTPNGEAYDAIQTNIRANHIAVVDHGRAGPACRIGDGAVSPWGQAPLSKQEKVMPDPNLRTILVDGLSVSTTDQGAQAIEKLLADKERIQQEKDAAYDQYQAHIVAKDAELAKKDATIDDLKTKIPDQAAMDRMVSDRANLISLAARIAPDVKPVGLSDAALRRAVVIAKRGEAVVKDKSDSYVDARFDILAEDAKSAAVADPFRDHLGAGNPFQAHLDAMQLRQAAFDDLEHFDVYGTERKQ